MHTKDILAAELRKIGLLDMALKASTGYYHDFLSPLTTPCLQLAADLAAIGSPEAMALRERHLNGEFDATKEESDAWAQSAEGQDAFNRLAAGRKRLCDRIGCTHAAAVTPVILLWAEGYDRSTHDPAAARIGLALCRDHAAELTPDQFLDAEQRAALTQSFRALGKAAPDFDAAELKLEPLC